MERTTENGTLDRIHNVYVIIITLTMYTLIAIKLSSLKSVLNVLPITYNANELIIAKMDTFETIKSTDIDASLNRRLSMNLLYLASYLSNHQILPWIDLGIKEKYTY